MSNTVSRRHALALLLFMASLYFFSFFQRVAVPGPVFNELQDDFSATAAQITALSSIYLYVYAGLQLFVGVMADRFGGVKVVLVSGVCLCAGSLVFPLSGSLTSLFVSRAFVGMGAAGMYLCMIKETDYFFGGKNFAVMMGIFSMIGYGGGLFGTLPFREAVSAAGGWRAPLLAVAGLSAAALVMTFILGRGAEAKRTLPPPAPMLKKLAAVIRNRKTYPVMGSVMINFSVYFCFQAVIGPKFLTDFLGISSGRAALFVFVMMLFTMTIILLSGPLSRMMDNRRKPFLVGSAALTALGAGMMTAGVAAGAPAWWFLAGMVITASGSGVFPVTASLTRELSAPDSAAVAIGVQNSLAYLAVAAAANLIGVILDAFRGAPAAGQPVIYPAAAYITVFAVMLFFSAVSIWVALRSGETRGARSGFDLEYESAA